MKLGGQTVESFTVEPDVRTLHTIKLPPPLMGTAEMTELQIDVDKTFVPAVVTKRRQQGPAGTGGPGLPRLRRSAVDDATDGDCARIGRRVATIVTAAALCVVHCRDHSAGPSWSRSRPGGPCRFSAHVVEGDSLVFSLRGGGEMTVAAAMVSSHRAGRSAHILNRRSKPLRPSPVPLPVPSQSLAVNPNSIR